MEEAEQITTLNKIRYNFDCSCLKCKHIIILMDVIRNQGIPTGAVCRCTACVDGVSGTDYYGEAIDCQYCDNGWITSAKIIETKDRLDEAIADLMILLEIKNEVDDVPSEPC